MPMSTSTKREWPSINEVGTTSNNLSSSSSPYFTLRRTTRSIASPSMNTAPTSEAASPLNSRTHRKSLDIAKYQYTPSTPSTPPRKKPKIERGAPTTPLSSIVPKTENVSPHIGVKAESSTPNPSSSAKKINTVKVKPLPLLALDRPHPAPPKWEEQYALIERMRKGIVAPVDDMGCERPRTTADADPKTLRFHILISLMLSSQTKDPVTSQAVTNLHTTLPGGLTAVSLSNASIDLIQSCINKVGFWRRKAEYIKDAANVLLEKEDGDVPQTLEGLCALKGVGPKMAFLALQCAWDINAGIGVDVHVHRITNRLRWHKPQTSTPEGTRLNLQSWLPPHLHKPINPLMVGFGQVICLPVGPRCDLCLLGDRGICPSRVRGVTGEGRKEVVFTFTRGDNNDDGHEGKTKPEHGEVGVAKVEVGYEGAEPLEPQLQTMKDEPDELETAKAETATMFEELASQPSSTIGVEGVLDILDQVDGTKDIDAPLSQSEATKAVKTETEW